MIINCIWSQICYFLSSVCWCQMCLVKIFASFLHTLSSYFWNLSACVCEIFVSRLSVLAVSPIPKHKTKWYLFLQHFYSMCMKCKFPSEVINTLHSFFQQISLYYLWQPFKQRLNGAKATMGFFSPSCSNTFSRTQNGWPSDRVWLSLPEKVKRVLDEKVKERLNKSTLSQWQHGFFFLMA